MLRKPIAACTLLFALLLLSVRTYPQSDARRIEIGGHFVTIRITDGEMPNGFFRDLDETLVGGGIRVGYNLTNNLSIEAEGNIFRRPPPPGEITKGRRSQGLFGVKMGRRYESIGVFGKIRSGFMRFDRIGSFSQTTPIHLDSKNNTYLAIDVGAVVELYVSQRTLVRFDIGDSIVRYSNRRVKDLQPGGIGELDPYYGHNPQFSVGVGFRF